MARKTEHGVFVPTNPDRYVGSNIRNIIYRSSWEKIAFQKLGVHPDIVAWSSECQQIPYYNPIKREHSIYVPDLLVKYQDAKGIGRVAMLEIKPAKEDPDRVSKGRINESTMMVRAINKAKWDAARAFCAKRNIEFRVITEQELFMFARS